MPVALGVFAIGVIAFCVLYVQEKRQQQDLATQIGQLGDLVSYSVETDEEMLSRFVEIEQYIPVLSSNPDQGQITQLQLIEQVNTVIIDRVSDPQLYPEIDISPEGNFKITYDSEDYVRVGDTNYKTLTFNIRIYELEYEQMRFFVSDISAMELLPTLVITRLDISPGGAKTSFDLDFDIYCRLD